MLICRHFFKTSRSPQGEYAAKTIQRIFNGKKNKAMYEYIRAVLVQLGAKMVKNGNKLSWTHVKGHSGDRWNDRADQLAGMGVKSEVCRAGRYSINSQATKRGTHDPPNPSSSSRNNASSSSSSSGRGSSGEKRKYSDISLSHSSSSSSSSIASSASSSASSISGPDAKKSNTNINRVWC